MTNSELGNLTVEWQQQGIFDIDLVCGGPPCQGYSGIGHRRSFSLHKVEIPSNHLFHEMIRIISFIKPKLFLFENVQGLVNSRWTKDGEKGEIFHDVLTSFISISGYIVRWQLVHAKDYSIPQNRPRLLVVGVRSDIINSIPEPEFGTFNLPKASAIRDGLLPSPVNNPPNPEEALGDLVDPLYLGKKATTFYIHEPKNDFQVQMRTTPSGLLLKQGDLLSEQEYSQHTPRIIEKFRYMLEHNGEIPTEMRTKKFSQRVIPRKWGTSGPNITATSLPEDYVHYEQPRALTVREWARLQTFPDWYYFSGPRTTGGRRRAGDPDQGIWDRDVPKYTQIGNAVPVFLARAVGKHFAKILSSSLTLA